MNVMDIAKEQINERLLMN